MLVDGLARGLAGLGHDVTVFARRDDPSQPPKLHAAPHLAIAFVDAGPFTSLRAGALAGWTNEFAAGLRHAWAADPPDVVHAFSSLSGEAALLAAAGETLPFVQTFVRLAERGRRRGDAGNAHALDMQAVMIRSAARIVATSSSHVFTLLGMGVRPSAIKFVPCGVDLQFFAPLRERARGDAFRVATLGRLCSGEGVADAIEALAFVEGVDLLVGGGEQAPAEPELDELRQLARSRGLSERVIFHGHIERAGVAAFLRSADAVICAPHTESIGTVALEAMACGIPVIASAVGGLVDVVADGITGLLVPPRAPRQIGYAIEALKSDRLRRERFGRFGVERTTARYGWMRIAADTFDVYASVARQSTHLSQSHA